MKNTIRLVLIAILGSSILHATTLVSDSGPYYTTSYTYNWISVAGWNMTSSKYTNKVTFTAIKEKIGNPLGTNVYSMKITVYDGGGALYSTAYTSPGTNKSVNISVPAGNYYNVTIWAQCGQGYSGTDYTRLKTTNITITD